MKNRLSVIIAAENDEDIIRNTLESIKWVDEIIVVIAETSFDKTEEIAKLYATKIFKVENNLGKQRNLGVKKSSGNWILVLDTDELISNSLVEEIRTILVKDELDGYRIPYKNHFLSHVIRWGGQSYSKLRLFRKDKGKIENLIVHPEILVEGKIGQTQNVIFHYSFRSLAQIYKKFTRYAYFESEIKLKRKEKVSLKKLTLYPLHMFWSIFVEDQGYRDGIWGLGLAVCFMYYEFARYWFLWKRQRKGNQAVYKDSGSSPE